MKDRDNSAIYKSLAQQQADQSAAYEAAMTIYAKNSRRDNVKEFWQRLRAKQERDKY